MRCRYTCDGSRSRRCRQGFSSFGAQTKVLATVIAHKHYLFHIMLFHFINVAPLLQCLSCGGVGSVDNCNRTTVCGHEEVIVKLLFFMNA